MKKIYLSFIALFLLAGCVFPQRPVSPVVDDNTSAIEQNTGQTGMKGLGEKTPTVQVTDLVIPSNTATSTPSPAPTMTDTPTLQPTAEVLNPLTGLPATDPSLLAYSPALVSVSNFPVSIRPQSGLSLAPHVYEMTIGMGETRFLAVFYGNYGPDTAQNVRLGSVRSGRLPFEQLRNLYDGFIIMAGAAPEVFTQLHATNFRDKLDFQTIRDLAEDRTARKGQPEFVPMSFDPAIQSGGVQGESLEIHWNYYNRVRWTYDPETGRYMREQDQSDGTGKFYPTVDKLNGEQLGFENLVVMAAEHNYIGKYMIEMNLLYVIREPAIFFRDGQAYEVNWTSLAPLGPIRFTYPDGTPFPYKPGRTFYEIIDSIQEIDQQEDGSWFLRFVNP